MIPTWIKAVLFATVLASLAYADEADIPKFKEKPTRYINRVVCSRFYPDKTENEMLIGDVSKHDLMFWFYLHGANCHICSMSGTAERIDEGLYEHNTGECRLQIRVSDKEVLLADPGGKCQPHHCGMNGRIDGERLYLAEKQERPRGIKKKDIDLAGEPVNDTNWLIHPEVRKINHIHHEVGSAEKANELTKEMKKCALNDGSVGIEGELYKDQRGTIRKYVVERRGDGIKARAEYYYDEKGVSRFTYRLREGSNGAKIWDRAYFDEKGQHLYTNHKSGGHGNTKSKVTTSVANPAVDYANLCRE